MIGGGLPNNLGDLVWILVGKFYYKPVLHEYRCQVAKSSQNFNLVRTEYVDMTLSIGKHASLSLYIYILTGHDNCIAFREIENFSFIKHVFIIWL